MRSWRRQQVVTLHKGRIVKAGIAVAVVLFLLLILPVRSGDFVRGEIVGKAFAPSTSGTGVGFDSDGNSTTTHYSTSEKRELYVRLDGSAEVIDVLVSRADFFDVHEGDRLELLERLNVFGHGPLSWRFMGVIERGDEDE